MQRTLLGIDIAFKTLWTIGIAMLPLFFITLTSDPFLLPKQILITSIVVISFILIAVRMVLTRTFSFTKTVLDLPLLLLAFSFTLSTLFSINRFDSAITLIPLLIVLTTYPILTNIVRNAQSVFMLMCALIAGGILTTLWSTLSIYGIFPLPVGIAQTAGFSPLGGHIDQAVFLGVCTLIAGYIALPLIKRVVTPQTVGFMVACFVLAVGTGVSISQLVTTQRAVLLPFATGFQIAMGAISQDGPRIAQGFFFGSGIGTFITDFTRFKPLAFNAYPDLWFLTFSQSSSFLFELLTTTGIIGLISYLFLMIRTLASPRTLIHNPLFLPVALLFGVSLLLPFSFSTFALLIVCLALFASIETLRQPKKGFVIELSMVALKKSLTHPHAESPTLTPSPILSRVSAAALMIVAVGVSVVALRYVFSDIRFTQSLSAASANNGSQTYLQQIDAISLFPYRDGYYRAFSQTNLALANSLLALEANSQTASPSSQTQQTALTLIQQSITSARTATELAPLTVANWNNLSSLYRTLIGLGDNAENFAIAAAQQAVALSPNSPQERITLGGIYYQLKRDDDAIREFQIAVNLKPDYPNAYYNLGYALKEKGDRDSALKAFQAVEQLVADNPQNLERIREDIRSLTGATPSGSSPTAPSQLQPISQPAQQLTTPSALPTPAARITPLPLPSLAQ
jgi:Flp pilus assembly protein TadD